MNYLVYLKNNILPTVIFCITFFSFANEKQFSDGEIPVNTMPSTYQYVDPELGIVNTTSVDPTAYLRLNINDDIPFNRNFTYVLNATVFPILPDGTIETAAAEQKIFEIEYNKDAGNFQYVDEVYFEIKNRYGIQIVVNSSVAFRSNGTPMNNIPDNVSIELGFKVDRYYELPPDTLPTLSYQELPSASEPCALKIDWSGSSSAILNASEEYELEWTWIDSYGLNTPLRQASDIDFSSRDFELNSTRIETKQTFYEIPLIYSRGYIIYRVRTVTRFAEDITKRYFGDWTSGNNGEVKVGDWSQVYQVLDSHEQDKNWQFQTSYAEDGKNKSVVSYFDGTLRNRQTVTKINSDENAVVGEVIYDMQGRPAIEVLPVPTDNNKIQYYPDFNISEQIVDPITGNLAIYSPKDFDWDTSTLNNSDPTCEVNLFGMSDVSGASKYYSSNNNPDTEKSFQDLVPDAQNFPFSQIVYTPDNTGRIRSKGGVGVQHQIGSDHEMKYYYSQPNSSLELNRLFGYQVGNYKHYKKNVVVDPNGQVSVSYIDPQGRTIATALAGGNPSKTDPNNPDLEEAILLPLDDELDAAQELHDRVASDLLNKLNENDKDTTKDNNNRYATGNFGVLQDGLRVDKQIVVIENFSNYKLEYELENTSNFTFDESCAEITFPFVYDIAIALNDDCNSELISENKIESFSRTEVAGNPIDRVWNTGEYGISKRLTVNKENLNNAWNSFLASAPDGCVLTEEDFIPQFISIDCDEVNCESVAYGITAFITEKLNILFGANAYTESGGVFTSTDSNVTIAIAELQESFLILEDLCTESQTCDVNTAMLLSDMSPYGQYGRLNYTLTYDTDNNIVEPIPFTDQLSVFNDDNKLYYQGNINDSANDANTFTWRNPATQYQEDGLNSLVEVTWVNDQWLPAIAVDDSGALVQEPNLGSTYNSTYGNLINSKYYIHPENLRYVTDFVTNWKTDWAQSLLPYHPEYCYLAYNKSICAVTYQGTTSFEFDTLLSEIIDFSDAEIAGFIPSLASSNTNIVDSDPFFNANYIGETTNNYAVQRKALMKEAMGINFDSTGVSMAQLAYTMVKCGNLATTCEPYSFGSLNPEQKQIFWNLYKGFYQGLKTRLYDVFISIHAQKNGCYNECLGGEDRTIADYMALIQTYSQQTTITTYNNAPALSQICTSASSSIYGAVAADGTDLYEKRFIPSDFLFNDLGVDVSNYPPTIDPDGVVANYYEETGKCKIQVDLELFLNGFLSKNNLVSPYDYEDGFMVLDLFEALGGEEADANGFTINNTINSNELIISTSLESICDKPITINLPESFSATSNTWNNLGSSWEILSLSNSFHDIPVTVDGNYAYQLLGEVKLSDGTIKEYVFKGNTCINLLNCIPECQTELPIDCDNPAEKDFSNFVLNDFADFLSYLDNNGGFFQTAYPDLEGIYDFNMPDCLRASWTFADISGVRIYTLSFVSDNDPDEFYNVTITFLPSKSNNITTSLSNTIEIVPNGDNYLFIYNGTLTAPVEETQNTSLTCCLEEEGCITLVNDGFESVETNLQAYINTHSASNSLPCITGNSTFTWISQTDWTNTNNHVDLWLPETSYPTNFLNDCTGTGSSYVLTDHKASPDGGVFISMAYNQGFLQFSDGIQSTDYTLQQGKTYKISFYMANLGRTYAGANVDGTVGEMGIKLKLSNNEELFSPLVGYSNTSSNDWQLVELEYTPTQTITSNFSFIAYSDVLNSISESGAICIDGIKVKECESETIECVPEHIAFASIVPGLSAGNITNGFDRENIGNAIVDFVNNNLNDLYFTGYDAVSGGSVRIRANNQLMANPLSQSTNSSGISFPIDNVSEIHVGAQPPILQLQNSTYGYSFDVINQDILDKDYDSESLKTVFYLVSHYNVNLNKTLFQNAILNKNIKPYFIVFEQSNNEANSFINTNLATLFDRPVVEFQSNSSIINSDYIKFNTDLDFKSNLTVFLESAYQQIQECDEEVSGSVKYMYPEISLRKQVSNAGSNGNILYDDVVFKVPSLKFAVNEEIEIDFNINLAAEDYTVNGNYDNAILTINGVDYTTANGLVITPIFSRDAFVQVICPDSDLLSASAYYSANFHMDYLDYTINSVNKRFDFSGNLQSTTTPVITMVTNKINLWNDPNLQTGYVNITGEAPASSCSSINPTFNDGIAYNFDQGANINLKTKYKITADIYDFGPDYDYFGNMLQLDHNVINTTNSDDPSTPVAEDAKYEVFFYMAGTPGSAETSRSIKSRSKVSNINIGPPVLDPNNIVTKKVNTNIFRLQADKKSFTKAKNVSQRFLEEDCEDCVVQQVAPLSCNEKYTTYMQFMNFQPAVFDGIQTDSQGNQIPVNVEVQVSSTIANYELLPLFDENYFCNANFAYLTDTYIYYITEKGINSVDHPLFLSIGEFGNTAVNYGYDNLDTLANEMELLIDGYTGNIDASGNATQTWSDYIDSQVKDANGNLTVCVPKPFGFYVELPPATDPCDGVAQALIETYIRDNYITYLDQLRNQFEREYINAAMENAVEHFSMEYPDKEYQYTLYYYDQAGNLIQTVAPEGVDRLGNGLSIEDKEALSNAIDITRDNNPVAEVPSQLPVHRMPTQYKYNSLNQLVWQQTPDGGITKFAYDDLGRIIASQNAKQAIVYLPETFGPKPFPRLRFSYTNYDPIGRITEAGEIDTNISENYSIDDNGKLLKGNEIQQDFSNSQFVERREVTYTNYDNPILLGTGTDDASSFFETTYQAYNSRNRVTSVLYFERILLDSFNLNNFNNAIFYNYDVHGNVKELVVQNNDMTIQNSDQEFKRLQYEYDLISGNVNRVVYQKDKKDQFMHRYTYDADNRIVGIETSGDGSIWENDATYEYYEHGPLARMNLGNKQIQGLDYIYTIQGWLKSVNSEAVLAENDYSQDGVIGGINETVARDVYGFSLQYFDNDYISRIPGADANIYTKSNVASSPTNLYNGNIKQMVSSMRHLSVDGINQNNSRTFTQNAQYFYDQLNRIKSMNASSVAINDRNIIMFQNDNAYSATYNFDRNGNLTGLTRNALKNNSSVAIDDFKYLYNKDANGNIINNQLTAVSDPLRVQLTTDLDDQLQVLQEELGITFDPSNETSHNYVYDEIGQLIQDKTEGLVIEWRVDGKVRKVIKRDVNRPNDNKRQEIVFQYDGLGNRIGKNVLNYKRNGDLRNEKPTFYNRDAQGNVMAIYEKYTKIRRNSITRERLFLKEQHIYGSSRLGLQESNELLASSDIRDVVLKDKKSQGFRLPFADVNGVSQNDIVASELASELAISINNLLNDGFDYKTSYKKQLQKLSNDIITKKIQTAYPEQGSVELIEAIHGSVSVYIENLNIKKAGLISMNYNALSQKLSNEIEPILNSFIEPRLVDETLLVKTNAESVLRSDVSGFALDFSGSNIATWSDNRVFNLLTNGSYAIETSVNLSNGLAITEGNHLIAQLVSRNIGRFGFRVQNRIYLHIKKENGLYYPYVRLYTHQLENIIVPVGGPLAGYQEMTFTPNQGFSTPELDIDFQLLLDANPSSITPITGVLTVNGITFSLGNSSLVTETITGPGSNLPLSLIFNTIGTDNSIDYTMCYFNYGITNPIGTYFQRSYLFDNGSGTIATEEAGDPNFNMTLNNVAMWIGGACGDPIIYPDSDGDAITDNIDLDDDNDGILDTVENGAGIATDTDGDGIINSLDLDSDDDGLYDIYESGVLNTGSVLDSNNDGTIDFTDPLVFGANGLDNALETIVDSGVVIYTIINTFPSSPVNFLNNDDDGDSVLTKDEDFDMAGNAINEDTDGDGVPNYLDQDDDNDSVTTYQEAQDLITYYGVTTAIGARADLDGDGILNYLDTDDDADGFFTYEEDTDSAGNPQGTDTDGDSIPDYIDAIDNLYGQPLGDIAFEDYANRIGDKRYELSNHLGNVLSVVTDRKLVRGGALSTSVYTTTFTSNQSPWTASENTQSVTIENEQLKVVTGAHLNGANGYYDLEAGQTYNVSVYVDKSEFTPQLEFGIWKGNSKLYGEYVLQSGTVSTTFTPSETDTYRLNLRLRDSGYSGGAEPFYIDNVSIIDVTDSNDVVNLNQFSADVIAYNDYYPFGMLLPNRHKSSSSYRYGFQGQEKDDELKGEGNSLNYKYRMHDPRVGRFFAVDPLTKKYPELTPYQFSSNMPMHAPEFEGLETSSELNAGGKVSFSLGGGFNASLYAGLSVRSDLGDVGAMASFNVAATTYLGGPGTSPLSPSLFTLTGSPAITLGVGTGSSMNLNLFNSQSGSGVNNSFDSSLTIGGNGVLSTGKNSDGSGRNQWLGASAIKLGNLQLASYNDVKKPPLFFGGGTDQFWSAGANVQFKNGDLTASYSFDLYYGLSDNTATFDQDRIIGGVNFDNQDIFDMLLNNGIERMSLQHANFGTLQTGTNTGSGTFWPSNSMHDAIPWPSIRNPNATFHHLFVPYNNGMTKPSLSKLSKFLEGKTFDNSLINSQSQQTPK